MAIAREEETEAINGTVAAGTETKKNMEPLVPNGLNVSMEEWMKLEEEWEMVEDDSEIDEEQLEFEDKMQEKKKTVNETQPTSERE